MENEVKENKALVFKPTDLTIDIGDKTYRLVYDLNAFCELEKKYESIDKILNMIFNAGRTAQTAVVKHEGVEVSAESIAIDGTPLNNLLDRLLDIKTLTLQDQLFLLWVGLMHETSIYNAHDEITGYSLSIDKLGSLLTAGQIRDNNHKVFAAIARDLVPSKEVPSKNEDAPKDEVE